MGDTRARALGWVGRVSVGGVSHHAKLSNPRVGAVRGLLNEKRVGRVQTAVAVSKKPRVKVRVRDGVRVSVNVRVRVGPQRGVYLGQLECAIEDGQRGEGEPVRVIDECE